MRSKIIFKNDNDIRDKKKKKIQKIAILAQL